MALWDDFLRLLLGHIFFLQGLVYTYLHITNEANGGCVKNEIIEYNRI